MAERLASEVRGAIQEDPGLPRANPTEAYWQRPAHPLAKSQSPALPKNSDVAVIGSGMTGIAATKAILENDPAMRVIVFEARELCSGATGRNGGHLSPNAFSEYKNLVCHLGLEQANKIDAYQKRNCDHVRSIATEFCPEESEARNVQSFNVICDQETLDYQTDAVEIYEKNNPEKIPTWSWIDSEIARKEYGIHNCHKVLTVPSGALWPYRLVTKVWEALLKMYSERLAVENLTPVKAIFHEPGLSEIYPYRLSTARGNVRVQKVLHCTNGHAGHLIPELRGRLWPLRGTMTVQKPGSEVPNHGSNRSWAFSYKTSYDPNTGLLNAGLLYLTQNARSGYFFFGGEKAKPIELLNSDDTEINGESLSFLQTTLVDSFGLENGWAPPNERLVSAWSGIMGFTADHLPIVGNIPNCFTGRTGNGEYMAAGFNGYGMPTCWLAGETMAQIALGKGKPGYFPDSYMLTEERFQGWTAAATAEEFLAEMCEETPVA